ncbi:MAG: trigger factor family protein, partial [Chitinophagaceae bacterium]|nr:trigger factor family protein [Chitinophagaceae bacterium]
MATISQENIGLQHEKIIIQLTKDDYLPSVQKSLKKLSRDAAIPGFRKGMVPIGHIKKIYGQSLFTDEVLKAAGSKLEEYLIETKAEIFARPIPAESQVQYTFNPDMPEDYTFEFEIGTRPAFEIPLFANTAAIPLHKVFITGDMLQEEIEKLQLKAGDMSETEEVQSENDVVHVEIKEENQDGQIVDDGINTKHSLLLKYFADDVRTMLMNKKVQDSITTTVGEAFDKEFKDAILKDLSL